MGNHNTSAWLWWIMDAIFIRTRFRYNYPEFKISNCQINHIEKLNSFKRKRRIECQDTTTWTVYRTTYKIRIFRIFKWILWVVKLLHVGLSLWLFLWLSNWLSCGIIPFKRIVKKYFWRIFQWGLASRTRNLQNCYNSKILSNISQFNTGLIFEYRVCNLRPVI